MVVVVQQHDQGEAHRGGQEAVDGVEHSVPMGHYHIKGVDLPQDFRRENEAQNRNLQRGRQLDVQPDLNPAGQVQQYQGQYAVERALIVPLENLAD